MFNPVTIHLEVGTVTDVPSHYIVVGKKENLKVNIYAYLKKKYLYIHTNIF